MDPTVKCTPFLDCATSLYSSYSLKLRSNIPIFLTITLSHYKCLAIYQEEYIHVVDDIYLFVPPPFFFAKHYINFMRNKSFITDLSLSAEACFLDYYGI